MHSFIHIFTIRRSVFGARGNERHLRTGQGVWPDSIYFSYIFWMGFFLGWLGIVKQQLGAQCIPLFYVYCSLKCLRNLFAAYSILLCVSCMHISIVNAVIGWIARARVWRVCVCVWECWFPLFWICYIYIASSQLRRKVSLFFAITWLFVPHTTINVQSKLRIRLHINSRSDFVCLIVCLVGCYTSKIHWMPHDLRCYVYFQLSWIL